MTSHVIMHEKHLSFVYGCAICALELRMEVYRNQKPHPKARSSEFYKRIGKIGREKQEAYHGDSIAQRIYNKTHKWR